MHELSIALSILDVVAEEAQRQGNVRVCAVHVKLGQLSGVVKEALQSAYNLAREDTPLHKADLIVEDVPARGFCPTCRDESELISIQELCCRECGTPAARITAGQEMEIVAFEIES